MSQVFQLTLDTPLFKGTVSTNTGMFINGQFIDALEGGRYNIQNPSTGEIITSISSGTSKDVDLAVQAAQRAFKSSWGLKVPGSTRGQMLSNLADLMEKHADELAALESLNCGKPYLSTRHMEIKTAIGMVRYYAGWADKVHGQTIETNENKLAYTRREPYGVVATILPWNVPILLFIVKLAPVLATGNTIVVKPSELTPLTALKIAGFINEAGFPPGVLNIVNGYGGAVGSPLSLHPDVQMITFTGSTTIGRRIQEAAAQSNLKVVALELGGKNPNIIFDDADLEQAVKWSTSGAFSNMGQLCISGSRILVQEGIYDAFLQKLTESAKALSSGTGDPFSEGTVHGPQMLQAHFDRIMRYIEIGKAEGAQVHYGGVPHERGGWFIHPTIFTECKSGMRIFKEEIFGPVAVVIKFKTEEEAIQVANDTEFGLACGVFTENISRAIRVSNALEAGTAWVNCYGWADVQVPFGGSKLSGFGRESGEEATELYTQVKAVHINTGARL